MKADYGGSNRTRFRYVGRTTAVAQTVQDTNSSVIRAIANDWTGERLVDWTGSNSNQRFYGTNGHHDVTWTADDAGAVTNRLRYDPWGTAVSTSGTSLPDFRFQGSWFDTNDDLSWVITRWYAPAQGRFVSQDSLLGELANPPSRHLYAYAEGEPVGRWDPDGRYWYVIRSGDTLSSIASKRLQGSANWPMIYNANRSNTTVVKSTSTIYAGKCLWIPWRWISYASSGYRSDSRCSGKSKPASYVRANRLLDGESGYSGSLFQTAAYVLGVRWPYFVNLSPQQLVALTKRWAGREKQDIQRTETMNSNVAYPNWMARQVLKNATRRGTTSSWNGLTEVYGNSTWPAEFDAAAFTMGEYIFYDQRYAPAAPKSLRSHEYVHVIQYESFGPLMLDYLRFSNVYGYRGGPYNKYEAIAYLWQGWTWAYGQASYSRYWRPAP